MIFRVPQVLLFTCLVFLTACASNTANQNAELESAPPFSLILEGGSIWKGSGSTPYTADIGIRGDRIVAIGGLAGQIAEQRIDVSGLDVVPGFIDIHSHAVRGNRDKSGLFTHPDAENYIRQGVTTVIGGPDGSSDVSISKLLSDLEDTPASINFGTFIGHNTVRKEVMGRADRAPTAAELDAMKLLVKTGMLDGAYGLSSGLKYIPGAYSETEEVIELARVAGEYDGIYISHMREEGLDLIKSVKETIRIGEEGGLPAQITHHKAMGPEMWGASAETLALVDAANVRGVDVTSDQYPYAASSTGISVLFPAWSLAGGRDQQLARFSDPETRARIKEGIVYNLIHDRGGNDPSRIAIANCDWDTSLNGKDFAEVLVERGQPVNMVAAAELALEIQTNGGCSGVFHAMSEEDVDRIMQHPRTMIASDGGIFVAGEGVPHPRNYGSFARVLAVYVRDRQVLTEAQAIYKMSKFPADRIGLSERGRIEVGAFADIAVMNLDTVQDHATFDQPHQLSSGVEHVVVNGVVVLNSGEMTGKRPGRSLRSQSHAVANSGLKQAIIRYDSIHHPVEGRFGMVVSQNALATQVGQDILAKGGNAVDAAVAVGFALAVTLPRAGNLGGSGFMLAHMAEEQKTYALDYRSAAPLAASVEKYSKASGGMDWDKLTFGPMAPAVPGTVAALYQSWQQFGSMPWADLLAPAQQLAADGIEVWPDLAHVLNMASAILNYYSAGSAYVKKDGQPWVAGDVLVQEDLAWSIGQIMQHGADAFYKGELGERIIKSFENNGGIISHEDLAAYRVRKRTPVQTSYRGKQVISMPPVSGGGVTLLQMLNMLEHFPVSEQGAGSAKNLHLLAEVMKRAAANRRSLLGDPDFVDVHVEGYISKELAKKMAADIDTGKAADVKTIKAEPVERYESRNTTQFSVMDRHGNAVSNTYTLGYSFGSGYVAEGTGILFDNQMRNFSYRSDSNHMNAMVPGKRMLSTMTPTIVLGEDGKVLLVTGTPGGGRIINVVLQVVVNVLDHDMNIAEATDQPRIHQGWRSQTLGIEKGMNPEVVGLLETMGHQVELKQTMGSTQSIMWRDGKFYGSADPRRPNALAIGLNKEPEIGRADLH